ncbi:hypothetical protein GCM10010517_36570 [Streptosporangium fragile]|uniref:ANTAR domain-containing protein n=1 Tax=Streptosporangium fragile TaxID=46186 RepID=A0ABN3VZ29_9ACTN
MGDATALAWARMAEVFDGMSDHDLGAVHEMARWSRANLPPGLVCLVDVLDAARDLSLAVLADRHEMTVEEVTAEIAAALAEGGEYNG